MSLEAPSSDSSRQHTAFQSSGWSIPQPAGGHRSLLEAVVWSVPAVAVTAAAPAAAASAAVNT